MGAACSKTRLEGAIAHWSLPSAGSRDKRVTLAACADDPAGPPFDHSGWTAVLQAHHRSHRAATCTAARAAASRAATFHARRRQPRCLSRRFLLRRTLGLAGAHRGP